MAVKIFIVLLSVVLVVSSWHHGHGRRRKPGVCPTNIFGEINPFFCHDDSDCITHMKCCPTMLGRYVCRMPYTIGVGRPDYTDYDRPSHSQCPRPHEDIRGSGFCATHQDCRYYERCCPNPGGGNVCKRPVRGYPPSDYYDD